jgi:hypothetical protein
VIELNRRWQALHLSDDPERLARCEAARRTLQARFDREHEEQRARTRFEHRLSEWLGKTDPPETADALAGLRGELASLREEGQKYGDAARSRLDVAERRLDQWARELQARRRQHPVVEAEQLAAGTSIDNAKRPSAGRR